MDLQADKLVRPPLFYGGGASDLVCVGLASLLREKGVPATKANERATQAVDRLGISAVQDANDRQSPVESLEAAWK